MTALGVLGGGGATEPPSRVVSNELARAHVGAAPNAYSSLARLIAQQQAFASAQHAWRSSQASSSGEFRTQGPLAARAVTGALLVGKQQPFDLSVDAWGCGDSLTPLDIATPTLASDSRFRLELDHSVQGVVEQYVNGPLGLEQVVRVTRLPPCAQRAGGSLSLRLRGAVGWSAVERAGIIELRGPRGQALSYGHAWTRDARGVELATSIRVIAGDVRVEVATANAALPIEIDPLAWQRSPQRVLEAPDGALGFGSSVALSDDTVLTSAPGGSTVGRVYFYHRQDLSLRPDVLEDPEQVVGGLFGLAVAIDGNVALVGAPNIINSDAPGRAYVLTRTTATAPWRVELPPLSTTELRATNDRFGAAVAVSGDLILVGAPEFANTGPAGPVVAGGAVFVFRRVKGEWRSMGQLSFPETCQRPSSLGTSLDNFNFGSSLALRGRTAIVGAPGFGDCPGAAYIFQATKNGAFGDGLALVPSPDQVAAPDGDRFGQAVALSETQALVGAPFWPDGEGSESSHGAVFIFDQADGEWLPRAPLEPPHGSDFGSSLAASSAVLAVGQAGLDGPANRTIYLYDPLTLALQDLPAIGNEAKTYWGAALATAGRAVLVGSQDLVGPGSVKLLLPGVGAACSSSGECDSGYCVSGVCCESSCDGACQGCSAEATGKEDGVCAFSRASTQCATSVCAADGSEQVAFVCDGGGTCAERHTSCGPGRCEGGRCSKSCATSDDCDSESYCDDGLCRERRAIAAACEQDNQCVTGSCADGVCCNESCSQQCEACDVAEHVGVCSPVDGLPRGRRTACDADVSNVCSQRVCDGVARETCAGFVGGEVRCESLVCEGYRSVPAFCGGGSCRAPACERHCESDYDCAGGFECGLVGVCVQGARSRRHIAACSWSGEGGAAESGMSVLVALAGIVWRRALARARRGKKKKGRVS